ncbi:uncharacterized protein C8R40DRAFT_1170343 [Lentinula edodes]|uniref:uncharacterized protein n=1 Tax=Lentinula edodes TaxID=5353 RepID=UPI001E8E114C|nr:uncharacterized protein C8R40DRAFT_1170343 [Lentinula edodes]KAH7875738.1 hypothetical protein C8R40DRAFT_1170343 [Lentinula edodes]
MSSQTSESQISGFQETQISRSFFHSFALDPCITFPIEAGMGIPQPLVNESNIASHELSPNANKRHCTCSILPKSSPPINPTLSPDSGNDTLSIFSALSSDDISTLQAELDEEDLDHETHSIQCALQEAMQASNSKKDNYSRHVSCYVSFIEVERERRSQEHPNRKSNLTTEPITVAKGALFLNFETTRPKVELEL